MIHLSPELFDFSVSNLDFTFKVLNLKLEIIYLLVFNGQKELEIFLPFSFFKDLGFELLNIITWRNFILLPKFWHIYWLRIWLRPFSFLLWLIDNARFFQTWDVLLDLGEIRTQSVD